MNINRKLLTKDHKHTRVSYLYMSQFSVVNPTLAEGKGTVNGGKGRGGEKRKQREHRDKRRGKGKYCKKKS